MRVALVYAPLLPGHVPSYGLQPLGILSIAAVLKQAGFATSVLDADIQGLSIAETADRLLAESPDLVGISLMTPQLLSALALCAALKHRRPGLSIVLGGAHIDATRGDIFSMTSMADFAIHGEGELALREVCQLLSTRGERAPDGSYKNLRALLAQVDNVILPDRQAPDGLARVNPARPYIADLDQVPPVDYSLLGPHDYELPMLPGPRVLSMMLSRGCPFSCTFCDAPQVMGKKLRRYSIPRIVQEIAQNRDRFGTRSFVFKDSTFSANVRWATELCQAMIDARLGIRFRCNTRADLLPPALLSLLKQAGCEVINIGVESGDPEILRRIRKEVELSHVVDAFERCREAGIRTYATLLVGAPGETDESIRRTLAFALRIRPSLVNFHIAIAYPGTPLYEEALARGQVEPRWWARQVRQGFDPRRASPFQARWGWVADGALRLPAFSAERWQRHLTRAWYLRPAFAWDSALFSLRQPDFLRHLYSLGRELLPLSRLRTLMPGYVAPADERLQILAKCPSAPTVVYAPRAVSTRRSLRVVRGAKGL